MPSTRRLWKNRMCVGVKRRVVLGVHEQQRVARAPQDCLGAQHDVRHQRVGDVREDEADRQRLAATQALGQEVRLVVQLRATADRTRSRIWALTSGMARQDPRDRRDGHVREVGHLAHACPASGRAVGIRLGAPPITPVPRRPAWLVRTAHALHPPHITRRPAASASGCSGNGSGRTVAHRPGGTGPPAGRVPGVHSVGPEERRGLPKVALTLLALGRPRAILMGNCSHRHQRARWDMRVTDIKTFIPMVGLRPQCLVKVETDVGIYGWGEAGLSSREEAVAAAVGHFRELHHRRRSDGSRRHLAAAVPQPVLRGRSGADGGDVGHRHRAPRHLRQGARGAGLRPPGRSAARLRAPVRHHPGGHGSGAHRGWAQTGRRPAGRSSASRPEGRRATRRMCSSRATRSH